MTVVEYWICWAPCCCGIPAPHQQNAWNEVDGGRGGGLPPSRLLALLKSKQTGGRIETIKFLISQWGVGNNSLLYSLSGVWRRKRNIGGRSFGLTQRMLEVPKNMICYLAWLSHREVKTYFVWCKNLFISSIYGVRKLVLWIMIPRHIT